MSLARKLRTAVRLWQRDGLSNVVSLATARGRDFLRANAIVSRSAARRATLLAESYNGGAEFSPVPIDAAEVLEARDSLLFPYVRRSYVDVAATAAAADRLSPVETAIYADSLFRIWDFGRIDELLPRWRVALAGTKFAPRFEQLSRRVALRLGRLTEAAAGLDPTDQGDAADQMLRGEIWDAQGRLEEAGEAFSCAVHRQPYDPLIRLNLAFHLLMAGKTLDGLASWGVADRLFDVYPLRHRGPQWRGEPLDGKVLLVVFEHGLGDMIQLARFLVPLRRRLPKSAIVGSVPRPLVGLLAESFPDIAFVDADAPDPAYDVFVPSVLLAPILEADSLEPRGHYLKLAQPAPGVPGGQSRLRVGVCWRGHPRHYELTRSIPLETFGRLFAVPCVEFVVLLNALTPAESDLLRTHDNVVVPPISDFRGLGALVAGCDVVVSVDTAVVHVAGAASRPCLLLSRPDACWRWGASGPRSPWYSSVDVLRHEGGDMNWDAMLAEAAARVAKLAQETVPAEAVPA